MAKRHSPWEYMGLTPEQQREVNISELIRLKKRKSLTEPSSCY